MSVLEALNNRFDTTTLETSEDEWWTVQRNDYFSPAKYTVCKQSSSSSDFLFHQNVEGEDQLTTLLDEQGIANDQWEPMTI